MHTSTILKLLGLVGIGVCTSLITSSLIKKGRAQEIDTTPVGRTIRADGVQQIAGDAPRTLEPTVAFALERVKIRANGGHVVVSAAVRIKETRPNVVNLWSLRVYDATGTTKLSERHYLDETFVTTAHQNTNPTFDETFALHPGRYIVQFLLYTIPANYDVAGLADEATARSFISVAGAGAVTILPD